MSANTAPIFPAVPFISTADLSNATACITRNTTTTANLASAPCNAVMLANVSTNGLRIDKVQVQASSSNMTAPTTAQTVILWLSNGSTAYVIDEYAVSVITPSTTVPAYNSYELYTNLVIPPTYTLWVSTTVSTTSSTNAITVTAFGGLY